jgi:hypothetical protein
MKVAVACLGLAVLLSGGTAFAGDYFHSCADPSGEFVITDGVLQAQRSGTDAHDRPEIKFKETRRITIRREEGQCFSKSCKQSFGFETESYLLFAEFDYQGHQHRTTFICELAGSGLPAACDCDRDSITYRQELKPAFATKGKPHKAK